MINMIQAELENSLSRLMEDHRSEMGEDDTNFRSHINPSPALLERVSPFLNGQF